jgi:ADP-ribosylglycohydrolase
VTSNLEVFQALLAAGSIRMRDADFLHRAPEPISGGPHFSRVEGMMLGLAIGDALGNTSEGIRASERNAQYGEIRNYQRHPRFGDTRGYPSDDSQLAFWTLDQLIVDGGFVPDHILDSFTRSEIFGIGRTVRQALHGRKAGLDWHQCGVASAGNGALMRIAPNLIPHLQSPGPGLWTDTALCSMLTHNDSLSISSCIAFVQVLWNLLAMEETPEPRWWVDTLCSVLKQLETSDLYECRSPALSGFRGTLSQLLERELAAAWKSRLPVDKACDRWYSGAFLLETVPSALYILMHHAGDPEEAIVRAVNDTWDNDTIAAIVGAVVGALHGADSLPERWRRDLSGRTGLDDDGRIQQLLAQAKAAFDRPDQEGEGGSILML